MKVILKPLSGTAEENLDRAKAEINRVMNFRGSVTNLKAEGKRLIVKFDVNPGWELPESEKVKSLKEWIPAKVRKVFKVLSVSAGEYE
jgi:hypothetical protein